MPLDLDATSTLPPIPLCDIRDSGPVALAERRREAMAALRSACLGSLPAPVRALVPLGDALARQWLARSCSPYKEEIRLIAKVLGGAGTYLINTSYEWACTAATRHEGKEAPVLVRTLDWPFAGLGRGALVAWQQGQAGEFFNVTWPGAVGVLTAMAPGRFVATINQAPLHRRTRGEWLRAGDIALNAVHTFARVTAPPPAHVLRAVFEQAQDYAEAKAMLAAAPVAKPVLFALAGMVVGECCVIERTESEASIIEGSILVANDWQSRRNAWEPRSCGGPVDTDSADRCAALAASASRADQPFAWLKPPVHNWATRLAVELCAGDGTLQLIGFEPADKDRPSIQATQRFELGRALARERFLHG